MDFSKTYLCIIGNFYYHWIPIKIMQKKNSCYLNALQNCYFVKILKYYFRLEKETAVLKIFESKIITWLTCWDLLSSTGNTDWSSSDNYSCQPTFYNIEQLYHCNILCIYCLSWLSILVAGFWAPDRFNYASSLPFFPGGNPSWIPAADGGTAIGLIVALAWPAAMGQLLQLVLMLEIKMIINAFLFMWKTGQTPVPTRFLWVTRR